MASSPETVITFNPTRLDNHGAITEITTSGTTIGANASAEASGP
jgi:hypothetical protein